MLPDSLIRQLSSRYKITVNSMSKFGGGSINHSAKIDTNKGACFLKWNTSSPSEMFALEEEGLGKLRETDLIRVPEVIGSGEPGHDGCPAYILMEWVDHTTFTDRAMGLLGELLAQLHKTEQETASFGFAHDNYIGTTVQKNTQTTTWLPFFRDQRLGYQVQLAQRNGRLPAQRRERFEKLMDQIERWLPDTGSEPSLLHGDLWSGNILLSTAGEPVLVDPAVYYGHREAEIAFTELFGGFSHRFYAAYNAVFPLEPGYKDRRDLYNLYHLLNHLNIFGDQYGERIDATLARFTA